MRHLWIVVAVLLVGSTAHAQTTWYVDDDNCPGGSGTLVDPFCLIQDGIAAASGGDTVMVLPGTYVENLDFLGKAITLTSQGGPAVTTVDGGAAGPVVTFQNGEGPSSILEQLTLTNGDNDSAGGVLCQAGAAPTIRDNVITNNRSEFGAGGISCFSAALITGNTVDSNNSSFGVGGIRCLGPATVTGNTISQNSSGFGDGGVSVSSGVLLANNVIQGNTVFDGFAAGVRMSGACTVKDNQILDNTHTDSEGGGIYCVGTGAVISGNWIQGNDGGISAVSTTDLCIVNNVISDSGLYPGLYAQDSTIKVDHTTFHDNGGSGGGALDIIESTITATNSILWDNRNFATFEIRLFSVNDPAVLNIDGCDVFGGLAAVQQVGAITTLNWGSSMLDADPQFVDAVGGDLRLTAPSPCINQALAGGPSTDIDGDSRPQAGTPDMGADEFVGTHTLEASTYVLLESTGGVVNLSIDLGSGAASQTYLMFGTVSGTLPGLALPGGAGILPINPDLLTSWVLRLAVQGSPALNGFVGTLDGSGTAAATLDTMGPLPAGAAGITMSFAAATVSPWDRATNPVNVVIQ